MENIKTTTLLKSHQGDPVIQKCIFLLETSSPDEITISEPTVAKTKELKTIYRQRLTVHKKLSLSTIEHSESLFDDLDKETDEYIAVFEIQFQSAAFMIFTNNKIERVIGGIYMQ